MDRWTVRRGGLATAAGVLVAALVGAGLVLTSDGEPRGPVTQRVAPSVAPSGTTLGSPTGSVAPDEALDVPLAWTAQDPSVGSPPAELVADAAPGATASTRLRVVALMNQDGRPRVVVQRTRGPAAATRVVEELQDAENVVSVAVDTRVTVDARGVRRAPTTADSLRSSQWALDRLEAERVWADYSEGAGSVVAVVDTGVDGGHPDLAGQLTSTGTDLVAGTGDGRVDPHGHGTHVAGIVAAARDNGLGIAGLAPSAKVMPVRVLDETGSGWNSDIAQGVIHAADNGADVINLSLGGPTDDPTTRTAVSYAMAKGVVVVAAAGNSRATGNTTNYPAAHPGVLAVASTERDDAGSAFSTTGPYVDIAAPGGRILSTVPGGYAYRSGTSMATPYVAAAAALATEITGGTLTTEQFEWRLTTSAWDLGPAGWDPEFGYGLANPHQTLCSLSDCGATAAPTVTPTPTPGPTASSAPAPSATSTPTTSPASPTSSPAPAPAPTSDPDTSPSQAPSSSSPAPSPEPTSEPTAARRSVRLVFTTDGGVTRRGHRVLIGMLVTDADTGRPVSGHQLVLRGWRDATVALRRSVATDEDGRATLRLRLRATTRFDLRSPDTATTQAARSPSSIRWRVR